MDPNMGDQGVKHLHSEERRRCPVENGEEINFWEHIGTKPLNFATNPDECDIQTVKKPKTPRDPMSHRIIEKRRRDRMNNCLADLSRLIPANYMKQGQGRIEKTEIIEMAIKHIKQLKAKLESLETKKEKPESSPYVLQKPCCSEKFYMGFKECEAELMRFLVENEGWDAKDQICSRLMKQLDEASKKYTGNLGGSVTFGNDPKKESDCPPSHLYNSGDCMSVDMYSSPASSSVYDSDMMDLSSFRNANGYLYTQDKHLRTLLKNGTTTSTETESGIATLSTDNLDSVPADGSEEGKLDADSKSGRQSSSPEQREDCRSACSGSRRGEDNSTYKFKQNITLRFSEEKRKASDTSSISSREGDNKVKVRRKVSKVKSLSPQSDSSIYPTSDYSSNGNGSSTTGDNPSTNDLSHDHKNIKEEFQLKGAVLPGFLLHPMGSFYLPISLSESQISNLGLLPDVMVPHTTSILHPISIPVNFGSHFLTMRNINIQTSFAQSRDMYCGAEPIECSKV